MIVYNDTHLKKESSPYWPGLAAEKDKLGRRRRQSQIWWQQSSIFAQNDLFLQLVHHLGSFESLSLPESAGSRWFLAACIWAALVFDFYWTYFAVDTLTSGGSTVSKEPSSRPGSHSILQVLPKRTRFEFKLVANTLEFSFICGVVILCIRQSLS